MGHEYFVHPQKPLNKAKSSLYDDISKDAPALPI